MPALGQMGSKMKPNSWLARLLYAAALCGLIALGHWYHDQQVNPLYRPFDAAEVTGTRPICGADPACVDRLMATLKARVVAMPDMPQAADAQP
jgi:hypothetical protein